MCLVARHAFLTFVQEDLDLVWMFRGQAQNKGSQLAFDDYSVKEPYNSLSASYIKGKIREKIRLASVTICLIGHTTYMSEWVAWEIETSVEEGNRLIGVRLHRNFYADIPPRGLVSRNAPIVDWQIDEIVRLIG